MPAIVLVAGLVLAIEAATPASAQAADLFPVDDWIGNGLKSAADVVLGPLKIGAEQIARLIATMVGALADLLIPKSLVRAGLDGIRWLVQLPAVGSDPAGAAQSVRMPHLFALRETLTWIGVTLLPFGLVLAAGRAFLAPGLDSESPSEILSRVLVAGLGLVVYEWAWGVATHLVRLITDAILGLPWVEDGVRRMLHSLLVGGAAGSAVASEFVIPLLLVAAGGALLALLLLRVGLEVATALLYAVGGLTLGLSVTSLGRRLLSAWLIAAAAVVALPVLWSIVFATGAALMLDTGETNGHGGFAAFVAQLYNVAAALGVFAIAIKLAQGVFRHAGGAIAAVAVAPTGASRSVGGPGARGPMRGLAQNATPAGLTRFSQQIRGGIRSGALAAVALPGRPALTAAGAAAHPIRSTQQAAAHLRDALSGGGAGRGLPGKMRGASSTTTSPGGRPSPGRSAATPPSGRHAGGQSVSTNGTSQDGREPTAPRQRRPRRARSSVRTRRDAVRRAQRRAADREFPPDQLCAADGRPVARLVVAPAARQAPRRTHRTEGPVSDGGNARGRLAQYRWGHRQAEAQRAGAQVREGSPCEQEGSPSGSFPLPVARGRVTIGPLANALGRPLRPELIAFLEVVAGIAGRDLVLTTGTNHSERTVSGNVSDHILGLAGDFGSVANGFPIGGGFGTMLAAAALRAAGVDTATALRIAAAGGGHNVCHDGWRVQVIWRTGGHFDHVHIGLRRGCGFTGIQTFFL